jgi:hypothetical protein
MISLRSAIKWLLAIVGLLFALIILKIVLVLTAKPKITVDYVAEYNRITRPANYDPNDNAAPYYQKAFDAFVEMPIELKVLRVNWPADLNSTEQALLESWLASNSQALEFFKIAANKPYYWLERRTDKDSHMCDDMLLPELSPMRHLTRALLWNAKLNASKGRMPVAIENIFTCYRVGKHKCRSSLLLMDQHNGLEIKKEAVSSTLVILNNVNVDSNTLKSLQNEFYSELDGDIYVPSIQSENLFIYDELQRYFIDNGKGTGRLASNPNFGLTLFWRPSLKLKLYYCFFGPTKNQTIKQVEKLSAISNQIMTKTPWQIKNGTYKYFEEIEKINNSNLLLYRFDINPAIILRLYHETNAQTEALIAVLAILRFKTDNGRLPATLDELVSVGDLRSVPMDPYSNGQLVYKPAGDNFKLYSVGENFVDDGGSTEVNPQSGRRGMSVFGTPAMDIVYWPVKKSNALYHQPSAEELEKLKAAKEADVFGTTQDPNLPTSNK